MKEQSVFLDKKNFLKSVDINPETCFLKVTSIDISQLSSDDISQISQCKIKFKKRNDSESDETHLLIFASISFEEVIKNKNKIDIDKICVNENKFDQIDFFLEGDFIDNCRIEIKYEISNHDVSLLNPLEEFKKHIQQKDNVKILFSAPFGQGKSTFLDFFFEENSRRYEVFKVFPVNYSISHNEDVFKYIKSELLFQLFKKDIEFDKYSFSYFQTTPQFFSSDPVRVLSPLVALMPKIGKSIYEIYESLNKLMEEYFDYHDKIQIDDKKQAEIFIKELYEKEGSVFEDNFYTQLIRQQIQKLKSSSGKENVLIVEDLDRMDPDHIFRVLNIFAAHFDSPEFDYGFSNKFGFDKIIVVGDYNNIKHTFAYRYGPKVHFEGYLNKYYSRAPFFYDNKNSISMITKSIQGRQDIGLGIITCVLTDLIESDCITLRELVKLKKEDLYAIISGHKEKSDKISKMYYHNFLHFNLILILQKVFDLDSLLEKLEICMNRLNSTGRRNYHAFTCLGLPSLVDIDSNRKTPYIFQLDYGVLKFEISQDHETDFMRLSSLKDTNDRDGISFHKKDFYETLMLNVKRYILVDGFK